MSISLIMVGCVVGHELRMYVKHLQFDVAYIQM